MKVLITLAQVLLMVFLCAAGAAAQAPSGEPQLIPLRVSLGDVDITKIVGAVALEEGIYRKNGLNVDQWITTGAAEIARGNGVMVPERFVRSGTADVGIGGGTPLVVSVATNVAAADRVILGSLDHVVHWWIVAQPEIKSLEDLKGKRIGYSGIGAMTHFILLELARRMGWHPTLDIAPMSNAISVANLLNGQVDAFICPGMAMVELKAKGIVPIADLRKEWGDVPIAGSGLTSTKKFVRENPEAVRRFIKSIVEAIALMKKDREVAFRALTKWYGVTDREKLNENYLVADTLPRKPYPAVEGIKKTMELYDSLQMRRHKPEDFYDDRFVRELDESGYIDSLYR